MMSWMQNMNFEWWYWCTPSSYQQHTLQSYMLTRWSHTSWLSWRILYHVVFDTLGAPADWKVSGRHASSFFIFTFPLDPNVLHWYLSVGIQILNPDWLFLFDENIPKTIITLICQLDSSLRITRVLHVKKNQLVPTIDENAGIDALFANSKEAGALSTATPFLDFLRTEGEHQNLASLLKPTQQ